MDGTNNLNYISKVNLDIVDVSYQWLSLDLPEEISITGMSVDNNHNLYISSLNSHNQDQNGTIIKVNTQNISDINYNWSTGLYAPFFSVVHGDSLYVCDESGVLHKIGLSDGVSTSVPIEGGANGVVISGDYIYVSAFNNDSGTIFVLNLSDGSVVPESADWSANIATEVNGPLGMRIYNNQLYVANLAGSVGQYDLFTPPPPTNVSCLLEGTMVWTLDGYVAIESLKEGDSIRTNNYSIAVTKVGKWTVDLNSEKDRADLGKKMYKIPAGWYGATSDTFISHYHRILYYMDSENSSRGYDIPSHLGLEVASPVEFAVDGKYTLYHLQLAIGNHFVVNGGCMVEAWNHADVFF